MLSVDVPMSAISDMRRSISSCSDLFIIDYEFIKTIIA